METKVDMSLDDIIAADRLEGDIETAAGGGQRAAVGTASLLSTTVSTVLIPRTRDLVHGIARTHSKGLVPGINSINTVDNSVGVLKSPN